MATAFGAHALGTALIVHFAIMATIERSPLGSHLPMVCKTREDYQSGLKRMRSKGSADLIYVHSPNYVIDLISTCFSAIRNPQSAIWPQSAIAYAIFPAEVALSAIGEFQIKEVANYEENGDADFPDYFGGG